jgi:hypothetical protein
MVRLVPIIVILLSIRISVIGRERASSAIWCAQIYAATGTDDYAGHQNFPQQRHLIIPTSNLQLALGQAR